MKNIEKNILNSFKLAKSDIIKIQDKYLDLKKIQANILDRLFKLETSKTKIQRPIKIVQEIKKPVIHTKRKIYVASKEGKKFHLHNCPYAQNIRPKMLVKFKTKTTALNNGYEPCKCIHRI